MHEQASVHTEKNTLIPPFNSSYPKPKPKNRPKPSCFFGNNFSGVLLQYFTCCYFNDVILKYRFGVGIEGFWFGFEQILVFSKKRCNYTNNSQHNNLLSTKLSRLKDNEVDQNVLLSSQRGLKDRNLERLSLE